MYLQMVLSADILLVDPESRLVRETLFCRFLMMWVGFFLLPISLASIFTPSATIAVATSETAATSRTFFSPAMKFANSQTNFHPHPSLQKLTRDHLITVPFALQLHWFLSSTQMLALSPFSYAGTLAMILRTSSMSPHASWPSWQTTHSIGGNSEQLHPQIETIHRVGSIGGKGRNCWLQHPCPHAWVLLAGGHELWTKMI